MAKSSLRKTKVPRGTKIYRPDQLPRDLIGACELFLNYGRRLRSNLGSLGFILAWHNLHACRLALSTQAANRIAQWAAVKFWNAAQAKDLKTLEVMIVGQLHTIARDAEGGHSALHITVDAGCDFGIWALLGAGMDPDIRTDANETPLHLAAIKNRHVAIEALLRSGATVDARGIDGWTPLHSAAFCVADLATAAVLIDNGADLTAKTHDAGETPEDIARREGNHDLAAYLVQRAARAA